MEQCNIAYISLQLCLEALHLTKISKKLKSPSQWKICWNVQKWVFQLWDYFWHGLGVQVFIEHKVICGVKLIFHHLQLKFWGKPVNFKGDIYMPFFEKYITKYCCQEKCTICIIVISRRKTPLKMKLISNFNHSVKASVIHRIKIGNIHWILRDWRGFLIVMKNWKCSQCTSNAFLTRRSSGQC